MSVYTNPTGAGYLGVAAVRGSRTVEFLLGSWAVDWKPGDRIAAFEVPEGILLTDEPRDEAPLTHYTVIKSKGIRVQLAGAALDSLGLVAGDDARAYQRDDGIYVVPAEADVFAEGS